MNIRTHSKLQTPRTFIPRASAQQAETPQDSSTLGLSRDDLKAGGYGVAGGLVLGGAGMLLGAHAGMNYGLGILDSMGGGSAVKLAGLLIALPVGIAYAGLGGVVGGAVGGGLGVAAGMGLHQLTQKPG